MFLSLAPGQAISYLDPQGGNDSTPHSPRPSPGILPPGPTNAARDFLPLPRPPPASLRPCLAPGPLGLSLGCAPQDSNSGAGSCFSPPSLEQLEGFEVIQDSRQLEVQYLKQLEVQVASRGAAGPVPARSELPAKINAASYQQLQVPAQQPTSAAASLKRRRLSTDSEAPHSNALNTCEPLRKKEPLKQLAFDLNSEPDQDGEATPPQDNETATRPSKQLKQTMGPTVPSSQNEGFSGSCHGYSHGHKSHQANQGFVPRPQLVASSEAVAVTSPVPDLGEAILGRSHPDAVATDASAPVLLPPGTVPGGASGTASKNPPLSWLPTTCQLRQQQEVLRGLDISRARNSWDSDKNVRANPPPSVQPQPKTRDSIVVRGDSASFAKGSWQSVCSAIGNQEQQLMASGLNPRMATQSLSTVTNVERSSGLSGPVSPESKLDSKSANAGIEQLCHTSKDQLHKCPVDAPCVMDSLGMRLFPEKKNRKRRFVPRSCWARDLLTTLP